MSTSPDEDCDLCISPAETLIFQSGRDRWDRSALREDQPDKSCRLLESRICLFNPSKNMMAFKVKVTSRLRYSVNPWIGLIKGGGEGEISIIFRHSFPEDNSAAEEWLKNESENMKNDGVMICWRRISQIPNNEAKLAQFWDATPVRSIRCCILQCELQTVLEIPTRVLQRGNDAETSLKQSLDIQTQSNENCNIKKMTIDSYKHHEWNDCKPEQRHRLSPNIHASGDFADKRLISKENLQKEHHVRRTVSGSPSYTVIYNECRESKMGSTIEFQTCNQPRAVSSSRRRFVSRFMVNGIVFVLFIAIMMRGLGNPINLAFRIHECLFEKEQPNQFFCKYVGLWCQPRDPICLFIEEWNPKYVLNFLQQLYTRDDDDRVEMGLVKEPLSSHPPKEEIH